jgi:hypothetical protein
MFLKLTVSATGCTINRIGRNRARSRIKQRPYPVWSSKLCPKPSYDSIGHMEKFMQAMELIRGGKSLP